MMTIKIMKLLKLMIIVKKIQKMILKIKKIKMMILLKQKEISRKKKILVIIHLIKVLK